MGGLEAARHDAVAAATTAPPIPDPPLASARPGTDFYHDNSSPSHRNTLAMLILLAVALIVIPALTYYGTTALFFQASKDVATGKTPPTIPYLVPGVFHTFSIAFEGAPKFFARLLYDNEYGLGC